MVRKSLKDSKTAVQDDVIDRRKIRRVTEFDDLILRLREEYGLGALLIHRAIMQQCGEERISIDTISRRIRELEGRKAS